MTFSVLARDLASGEVGVAIASCVLAIGSRALRATPDGLLVVQGGGWTQDLDVGQTALREGADVAVRRLSALGRQDAQYAALRPGADPVTWSGTTASPWSGALLERGVASLEHVG